MLKHVGYNLSLSFMAQKQALYRQTVTEEDRKICIG